MPMLVRAYDDSDPRIQEEALRKSLFLAKQLDMQVTVMHCFLLMDCYFKKFTFSYFVVCNNNHKLIAHLLEENHLYLLDL